MAYGGLLLDIVYVNFSNLFINFSVIIIWRMTSGEKKKQLQKLHTKLTKYYIHVVNHLQQQVAVNWEDIESIIRRWYSMNVFDTPDGAMATCLECASTQCFLKRYFKATHNCRSW